MPTPENPIEISSARCTGCGLCGNACPFGAIEIVDRLAVIDYDTCTLCGSCVSICSTQHAILNHQQPTGVPPKKHAGEVWVLGETTLDGELSSPTAELLGKAQELARALKTRVGILLIGYQLNPAAKQAESRGAQTIYAADHVQLKDFKDEPYANVIETAVRAFKPEILLGSATAIGRAALPRAAILLHTGLTADCTQLTIDPASGLLMQTRPAFGGNIMATIQCADHSPQMATVRPGVFPVPTPSLNRQTIKRVNVSIPDDRLNSGIVWLDAIRIDEGTGELRDAEIIVTAGAGAGGPAGVRLVNRLAHALGGVLGSTRAVVDAGWVEYSHQVGQTGVTVQPKIYIACGVSGAIQHIVGMRSSGRIIAINKDPDAPIFNYADVGIVGDLREIIPPLIKEVNKSHD